MVSACGNQPEAAPDGVWPGLKSQIDCCVATRLRSPDGARTLVFEPDEEEKVHVRLSAGWLGQRDITVLEGPATVSWAPDNRSFFISDSEGSGQTSTFRLFRAPENGAITELTLAHSVAVAAYRAHVGCPADASDPEVWGLGWSSGGDRAFVLVQSSIHQPCGQADRYMVMAVAANDGRVVEQVDTREAARRFASLIPGNVLGVTAP